MWTFYLSAALLSVIQIQHVVATGCNLESVTSPSASTLDVAWSSDAEASFYLLDMRVVNSTTIAPLIVMQAATRTQRLIQGLQPGRFYQVTLKVFHFYNVLCTHTVITMTVPATSQITFSKAISSTSIKFEWSNVTGADSFILFVEDLSSPIKRYNHTFTTLVGQMDGLTPATIYNCYVYSANSAGRGAKSNTRTIMTLVQPPTHVVVQSTGKSTARVTWNSVNKILLYQVTVSDKDDPSNTVVIRNTSATSMNINNLEPCSSYTVAVSSVSIFLLPGEASNVTHTTSTINPVTTVSVDYSCSSGMVTVTWNLEFGANLYRATAVDGTGASLNCTSASTSCQIIMLKCGERYRVHVTAISDDCESTSNKSSLFETVPCAPAKPEAKHDCSSNVIDFVWEPTNNTLYYVATAVDNTGAVRECRTSDSRCYFTNAGCGQYYTYSVYAVSSECNSEGSRPEFVRTSPCLPTNVKTAAECSSDMLTTTWNSAAGALSYTVEAEGNTGKTYNCTSSSRGCTVTGVPCGEHLSVWIVASNDNCSTPRVPGEVAQTAPCTPTNESASVECSEDSAQLNWMTSFGSIFYIAVAQDGNGNSHSCNSMGSNCVIEGLTCGQNYTASIIGTNLKCNSSATPEVAFMTAPCPPTNIEAFRDCDANHALIVWPKNPTGLFTGTLEDQSGAQLNCTSNTANSCTIPSLPCGKKYNVTVTNSDGNCLSTSAPISMDSVPCAPGNITTNLSCGTNNLTVSWISSAAPLNYSVTAEPLVGNTSPVMCHTNSASCVLSGLQCGQTYNVSVKASSGSCSGPYGAPQTMQTAPCSPQNLTAATNCGTNSLLASWNASLGATAYTAMVTGPSGFSENCSSLDHTCSFVGLRCASQYTVTVTSRDSRCTSSPSQTVLMTGPCDPGNLTSVLQCGSDTATVSWVAATGVVAYTVLAREGGSSHYTSCRSSTTSCQLKQLQCGKVYNLTVMADDATCNSTGATAAVLMTEPCQPVIVSAQAPCQSEEVQISWHQASGVVNYLVTATGSLEYVKVHNTTQTLLSATLPCGQDYNVTVQGQGSECDSIPSSPAFFKTTPCQPQGIRGYLDCVTNSARISWDVAPGADSYTVSAVGGEDYMANCTTSTNTTCEVEGLACGVLYDFSVAAKNSKCESQPSATLNLQTAPCSLSSITAFPQCHNSSILVMWDLMEGSEGNTVYVATAEASDHTTLVCNNTGTSCYLHGAQCDLRYTIIVAASSDRCSSMRSPPHRVSMEPCPPRGVMVNASCEDHNAMVSWTPSPVAEMYHVVAMATDGHVHSCNTTSSNCSISELHCDQQYTVVVTASHENCSSKASQNVTLKTGSCQPNGLSVTFDCRNQSAMLTWMPSDNANDYYGCAQARNGDMLYCHSTDLTCTIGGLDCGTVYNFSVQASDGTCNSSFSDSVQSGAVPCPPDAIEVQLMPMEMEVQVMRFSWTQVSCGNTEYLLGLTGSLLGDSRALFELTSYWTSTTYYEIPLPCGSSYVATVRSRDAAGTSSESERLNGTTAPCPPSGVYSGNGSFATVSWNASVFATTYTVYDNSVTPKAQRCSVAGLSCSLLNMTSSDLLITASNAAGESQVANVTHVETLDRRRRDLSEQTAVYGVFSPLVLDVKQTMSTVVFIEWSQVEGASHYNLAIRKQGSSSEDQELTVYGESIIVTDLSPNSTYCFSVSAVYSADSGPESEPVCVPTGQGLLQ